MATKRTNTPTKSMKQRTATLMNTRAATQTSRKRDMFAEIAEGFRALRDTREGKRTLRTHVVASRAVPDVKPAELVKLRERLALSRPVFADVLRTNPRTLENWEQGRAKPNAQAALLIRMVERYPDTMERLATL
jgi:putative transcriptional regulator